MGSLTNVLLIIISCHVLFWFRVVALSLRQAEKEAKANLRCLWQDYTPAPETRKFFGLVVEVVSADTIVVVEVPVDKGGHAAFLTGGVLPEETLLALCVADEMRVSLSSIW